MTDLIFAHPAFFIALVVTILAQRLMGTR